MSYRAGVGDEQAPPGGGSSFFLRERGAPAGSI